MTADFKKFSNDRFSQNLAQAINSPRGALVTGSITAGETVVVEANGTTTASTTVSARRTGALLSSHNCLNHRFNWTISGTILTVTASGNMTNDEAFSFWVF